MGIYLSSKACCECQLKETNFISHSFHKRGHSKVYVSPVTQSVYTIKESGCIRSEGITVELPLKDSQNKGHGTFDSL